MRLQLKSGLIVCVFGFVTMGWISFCSGQNPQPTPVPGSKDQGTAAAAGQLPAQLTAQPPLNSYPEAFEEQS